MSINIGAGVKPALDATDVIQKAAVYIVEGRPYCFYFDGWHGAGWYRCGFAHRRNLGWGGEYGWQGWNYGPAEKRYGRSGTTVREGTTVRSKSTVREKTEGPSKDVGGGTTIRRSTTGAGSEGGGRNQRRRCAHRRRQGGGWCTRRHQARWRWREAVTPAPSAPIEKKGATP